MKIYTPMTLGDLIARLDELGDAEVYGLNGIIHSYTDFYDRPATEPCDWRRPASLLAEQYRRQIGTSMPGWGGGDYAIDADKLIYYAEMGDRRCPIIAALEPADDGSYDMVGIREND